VRLGPTPPEHVVAVLAALPRVWPSARIVAQPGSRWLVRTLSHVAALALGVALARGLWRAPTPHAPEPVEFVREVRVEVPVEVLVEVPVEVAVLKEIRVEVPVEVVRVVEVEREVPGPVRIEYVERVVTHPLQLDADRALALFEGAGRALLALSARASRDGLAPRPPHDTDRSRLAQSDRVVSPSAAADGGGQPGLEAVVIARDGSRITVRTRGPVADVVPALIATLDDPDAAVASAAEAHLEALRRRLSTDGGAVQVTNARPVRRFDRAPGATFGQPFDPTEDRRSRWRDWWVHSPAFAAPTAGDF